jgi:small subunit ribosomal protein S23
MKNKGFSKARAYDEARREFYKHRLLQDVRRRIAKEEALHVGAYFGKGPLEIGMELEDKAFESWKAWAARQIEDEEQMRAQLFSGPQQPSELTQELASDEVLEEVPTAKQPARQPARIM